MPLLSSANRTLNDQEEQEMLDEAKTIYNKPVYYREMSFFKK
jgi:hypothetical protein